MATTPKPQPKSRSTPKPRRRQPAKAAQPAPSRPRSAPVPAPTSRPKRPNGGAEAAGRGERAGKGAGRGARGAAQPVREGRLSASDWIRAGQALLREQGIQAIKLAALTQRLGVSTGSFYHHFADFEQYLGALADDYSVERVQRDLDAATSDGDAGPVERLRRLARHSLQEGTFDLDRAMRIWATMDPRAEEAMRRGEALVLEFITQAFVDLGFERADAALRARILLSFNVSPLTHSGANMGAAYYRGCLRLLIQDAPAAAAPAGRARAGTARQRPASPRARKVRA